MVYSKIERRKISQLKYMEKLDLHDNFISTIDERAFDKLKRLEHLIMDDNDLDELTVKSFEGLTTLQTLSMDGVATRGRSVHLWMRDVQDGERGGADGPGRLDPQVS